MLKIALIEAAHWHVPLYLDGIASPDVEVAAVHDSEGDIGRALADRLGARSYASIDELLAAEEIDFAFAFGRPVDMPDIGHRLIAAGIPFALEKPCGINPEMVERLRSAADAAGHFVAVPYIYRVGELRGALHDIEGGLPADFKHMSFRFVGGPPSRYLDGGCAWMLDPAVSGGGPTMNLAGHFIDLFRLLTGQQVQSVAAVMTSAVHAQAIEDYAVLTLTGSAGAVCVIETGYTFPSKPGLPREFNFSLRSGKNYITSAAGGVEVRDVTRPEATARMLEVELNNDHYYSVFARDTIDRFRRGAPPACSLADAVAVMQVVDAAYRSARQGGQPITTG